MPRTIINILICTREMERNGVKLVNLKKKNHFVTFQFKTNQKIWAEILIGEKNKLTGSDFMGKGPP